MPTKHMHVTSSRVFNNNSRKKARVIAYNIIVSSEWNETGVNDVNVESVRRDGKLCAVRTMLRIVG